jgi:hypothetical protein
MVLKKQDRAKAQIQKPATRAVVNPARKLQKHIVKNTVDKGGANEG